MCCTRFRNASLDSFRKGFSLCFVAIASSVIGLVLHVLLLSREGDLLREDRLRASIVDVIITRGLEDPRPRPPLTTMLLGEAERARDGLLYSHMFLR